MKNVFLVVFGLFSILSYSQKINEYEFIMVPTKFEFQRSENEYRLNTLLKYRLEDYGFKAFYTSDQINNNYADRCLYLNANVVNESTMFLTKLYIVFKDCNNAIIFQSDIGTSKVKPRKEAYNEALESALKSVKAIHYNFTGKKLEPVALDYESEVILAGETTEVINENTLFAQPIPNGFQLIDSSPKVVLKMYKTSQPEYFTANSGDRNGVVFKKNNQWFFEYYAQDKLVSEQLTIKF